MISEIDDHIDQWHRCPIYDTKQALIAWFILKEKYDITIPAVHTGPDSVISYCWNNGEHYLDLEFVPNELPNFYYRNNEEACSSDWDVGKEDILEIMVKKILITCGGKE